MRVRTANCQHSGTSRGNILTPLYMLDDRYARYALVYTAHALARREDMDSIFFA